MGLNKSKGNMYEFVTHTWNVVKGECSHSCSYCYMKRWGKQKPIRFDEKELKTDLGEGNFIFVGSSTDMFAKDVPSEWIVKTLEHMGKYPKNKYLLQTKNPERYFFYASLITDNMIIGTTIETNRFYPEYMGDTPTPARRAEAMAMYDHDKFVTIEPIIDFDPIAFADLLNSFKPKWVNIGADSSNSGLLEPSSESIEYLQVFLSAKITIKKNMKRIS